MKVKKVQRTGSTQKSSVTKKVETPRITFTEILSNLEDDRGRSKELLDELLRKLKARASSLLKIEQLRPWCSTVK